MAIGIPERGTEDMKKERITLRKRGQFTLPKAFLEELNLREGDSLEARLDEKGFLTLVPLIEVPVDQAWFWTEKWQREEAEAEGDIITGRTKSFSNLDDLFADLESDDE